MFKKKKNVQKNLNDFVFTKLATSSRFLGLSKLPGGLFLLPSVEQGEKPHVTLVR